MSLRAVETSEGTDARRVIRWPSPGIKGGGRSHRNGPPQRCPRDRAGWVALDASSAGT